MIKIRHFRRGDEAALLEVFHSAVAGTAVRDYTAEQIHAWLADNRDPLAWEAKMRSLSPFVAESEGVIVGYGDVQPSGLIDHFFVSAEYGRQGVGNALMEQIHQWAGQNDILSLHAWVSLTARPFFEKWGFKVITPNRAEIGDIHLENFVMRKNVIEAG